MLKQPKVIAILCFVFTALTLFINYLSFALPINGKDTKQLSDQYPNLFTPAPSTFAIWGIIYMSLLAYLFWQAKVIIDKNANIQSLATERIGKLYIASCLFNAAWIFAWHYEKLVLSVIIMLFILTVLIQINMILYESVWPEKTLLKWFVKLPFGLYLGWISVATIANITACLVGNGITSFGLEPQYWSIIVICVGIAIAIWSLIKHNNIGHGLAVIWALNGIKIARNLDVIPNASIAMVAVSGMIIISLVVIWRVRFWLAGA